MTLIRTSTQYEALLEALNTLLREDPETGSAAARRLDQLAVAIEEYERAQFPSELPTPVEAIEFRMDQLGLERRDLEPLIGSRSRVSEVLSGRRPLTVRMIRALNQHLGVPTDLLIQDPQSIVSSVSDLEWEKFPWKEMLRRGWLEQDDEEITSKVAEYVTSVIPDRYMPALCRRTDSASLGAVDSMGLVAWCARVLHRAMEEDSSGEFRRPDDKSSFMEAVAGLSGQESGPLRAAGFLRENGIRLVIEPHLPRTRLDGAALLGIDNQPVIGMTIRYDRLDSFWFTLLHEVAHVLLHLGGGVDVIADDLDLDRSESIVETEADTAARNAFISRQIWRRSDAYRLRTRQAIESLADNLGIHRAVVAGRLRFETNNYQVFGGMLGKGEVRPLFSSEDWS